MTKVAPIQGRKKDKLAKECLFCQTKNVQPFFCGGEIGRKKTFKRIACNGTIYNIVTRTLELIDWIGLGANAVKMKNVAV